MTVPPPIPSNRRKPIALAKLATIFAVVLGIAFGLCTIGVYSNGSTGNRLGTAIGYMISASVIVEALCAVGLLCVGVAAIVRSINRED